MTDKDKEKKRNIGWWIKKMLKQNVNTSIKKSHNKILFKFLKNKMKQKIK